MNWKQVKDKVWRLARETTRRDEIRATPPQSSDQGADVARPAEEISAASEKVQLWRRRVLHRKGALMHTAMGFGGGQYSLAMLDTSGIVVSWYEQTDVGDTAKDVVNRHVSQFYTPEDVARSLPEQELHSARTDGSNTQEGWRRRADGAVYWGTTVIDALLLRDGRLQGYSHLTRQTRDPMETVRPVEPAVQRRKSALTRLLNLGRSGARGSYAMSSSA
jgi:hypothetical protein